MPLFQRAVLAKHLKLQDQSNVQKAFKKYSKYFHNPTIQQNIRESKEEQYQAKFLDELFVNVLGYTLNPQPNFNLTTELKNEKNAKKADGAILKDGNALAVIELKGTNTKDLEKVRQQAFDYKANQSGCVYVITSNFEKLRFYINNAVEFEEFDLFHLNEKDFALFYLCLGHGNLVNNVPLTIKDASLQEEEQITKKFYSDYSQFKRELFRDLVKRNMKNEAFRTELSLEDTERGQKNIKHKLFKKSQKLIDRFLFIFFAEDRDLLPPNSTEKILADWDRLNEMDTNIPLYNRFKLYFNYLDSGRKGTGKKAEIFAYNGGLFRPDPLLDSLLISDELLYKHTKTLARYDFESQVDVNILGHIFENSLNEIESVNAEIEGTNFDKQTTKRKKDGVFYTPKYITKYIVDNTVGKLCEEKKNEMGIVDGEFTPNRQTPTKKRLLETLNKYRVWLLQLTICDPACGSGAFLNQALDFLITEHKKVDELQTILLGGGFVFPEIENTVLENNIFGVDLNEESVEIAKLSLWLRTAQPRRKLNELNNNIKCGNSLIESKSVAGEKAFMWEVAFPKVFEGGGFDVIIGNPPYVRAELLSPYLEYFQQHFEVYHSASDLFAYFYELGSKIVNPHGVMGFISNTFDKTTAGFVLREYLSKKVTFQKYIDFTEVQIFEGATTYPIIVTLTPLSSNGSKFKFIKIPKSSQSTVIDIDNHKTLIIGQETLTPEGWSFLPIEKTNIFKKLKELDTIREKYGKCYYGVKTALNEAFIFDKNIQISEHVKHIYEGKEIKKWHTPTPEQKLILFKSKWTKLTYGENKDDLEAFDLIKSQFPQLMNHLAPYEDKARKRYDKGDYWWELRNCAYYDLFDEPKIIFPNLQNSNKFCLDSKGVFVNAPAVFLPVNSKALLCVLNSKVVWEFLKSICVVRSGGYIEVKPQYFEQIPVPNFNQEEIFDLKTDEIIRATSEVQCAIIKFTNYIKSSFFINKLSRKLESWHELSFSDFIKELNKAIKAVNKERATSELAPIAELTKTDEMEWMELFNTKKAEAQSLKAEIDKTDKEIDQMVYELYRLTDEEIAIVEAG